MIGHDAYRESEIDLAGPVKLVELLYQGAIDATRQARRDLAQGEILARGRAASKASAILMELASSLDHERGGEIARNLGELYQYVMMRITEGHAKASDVSLAEAEHLMRELASAWPTPVHEVFASADAECPHLSCTF